MKKIKRFLISHSNVSLSWTSDMWNIIPNITLIYHERLKGISFSFEFLKLYFWVEIHYIPYKEDL